MRYLVILTLLLGALVSPAPVQAGSLLDACMARARTTHPAWSYDQRRAACKVERRVTARVDTRPTSAQLGSPTLGGVGTATDPHGVLAWRTGNLFWRFTTTVHYHWVLTCVPAPPYGCVQNGGYAWVIDSVDCARDYSYGYGLAIERCDKWAISDSGWLGYAVGADYTVSLLHVSEGQKTRAFWWVVQVPGSSPPGGANPACCRTTSRWST